MVMGIRFLAPLEPKPMSLEFSGQLVLSSTGYLLLTVPNDIALGAFKSLREPGIELPKHQGRPFNAHITVMRPEEVSQIGPGKITERGQEFTYRIEGGDTIAAQRPEDEYGRYWFLKVVSPALAALRRVYGLADREVPFHITFAARRKHVLKRNTVMKLAMRSLRTRELLQRGILHVEERQS